MTLSLSITLLFILNDISCVFLSTNKPKHPDKIKQISKSAEVLTEHHNKPSKISEQEGNSNNVIPILKFNSRENSKRSDSQNKIPKPPKKPLKIDERQNKDSEKRMKNGDPHSFSLPHLSTKHSVSEKYEVSRSDAFLIQQVDTKVMDLLPHITMKREVPANDVANVINCFVDYFPYTGEPFNFTLYHPERPLQTISKALWVAKCLEQTGCKKISAYFRRNLLGAIETKNVYYGFEDAKKNQKCSPSVLNLHKMVEESELNVIPRFFAIRLAKLLEGKIRENRGLYQKLTKLYVEARERYIDIKEYFQHKINYVAQSVANAIEDANPEDLEKGAALLGFPSDTIQKLNWVFEAIEKDIDEVIIFDRNEKTWLPSLWLQDFALIELNKEPPGRVFYFIRSCENVADVDSRWYNSYPDLYDQRDPPLSDTGIVDCNILADWLISNDEIDAVYSSPFMRTLQTASILLAKVSNDQDDDGVSIRLEAGLVGKNNYRKSVIQPKEILREYFELSNFYNEKFSVDGVNKHREESSFDSSVDDFDSAVLEMRIKSVMNDRRANSERIVFVTHGTTIGAAHKVLTGKRAYVEKSTISKFVELDHRGSNKFRLDYSGSLEHFYYKPTLTKNVSQSSTSTS